MTNTVVKVVFGAHDQRYPMIGKIVNLKDAEHLKRKGMVRFVSQKFLDNWDGTSVALTRIFCVSDFSQIKVL